MKKYISIYHTDYWYFYYNIGQFNIKNLNGVEFSVLNEKNEDDVFFNLNFYNIKGLENMIEENEYIEKGSKEYTTFIEKYKLLKQNKIDYFISSIYYPYEYRSINDCDLKNSTIFEIKSKPLKPNYAHIFINENESITPEKIIFWLKKLSVEIFGEEIDFEILDFCTRAETIKLYNTDGRF